MNSSASSISLPFNYIILVRLSDTHLTSSPCELSECWVSFLSKKCLQPTINVLEKSTVIQILLLLLTLHYLLSVNRCFFSLNLTFFINWLELLMGCCEKNTITSSLAEETPRGEIKALHIKRYINLLYFNYIKLKNKMNNKNIKSLLFSFARFINMKIPVFTFLATHLIW